MSQLLPFILSSIIYRLDVLKQPAMYIVKQSTHICLCLMVDIPLRDCASYRRRGRRRRLDVLLMFVYNNQFCCLIKTKIWLWWFLVDYKQSLQQIYKRIYKYTEAVWSGAGYVFEDREHPEKLNVCFVYINPVGKPKLMQVVGFLY